MPNSTSGTASKGTSAAAKGTPNGMSLTAQMAKRARTSDRVATGILGVFIGIVCLLVVAMVVYILASGGVKMLDWDFLTSNPSDGGIGPEIFNSFYLLILTLLISLPLSLGAAIFLTQYAPEGPVTSVIKTIIEVLSSLPSIVVGLFGFLVFVLKFGWSFSIIAGACALTMFNLPIMVRVIQQALEQVPREQRDAGLAMGLTRWETTIHVLIPSAIPAIVTGIILSAGRVFGEAAALIYTAGQSAPAIDFTNFDITSPSCPWNIFRPAETLAVHIWKLNSESVVANAAEISAGTAALLVTCILIFNILARVIGRALEKKVTAA
jgi:phosphate transport system permease protein